MTKFMLVYRGGAPMADRPEEQARTMQAWGAWYGRLGQAVVDGGAPFGARAAVDSSGPVDAAGGLGGYTVLTAPSLAAATELTEGCPVLGQGGTVDIYECIEMGG